MCENWKKSNHFSWKRNLIIWFGIKNKCKVNLQWIYFSLYSSNLMKQEYIQFEKFYFTLVITRSTPPPTLSGHHQCCRQASNRPPPLLSPLVVVGHHHCWPPLLTMSHHRHRPTTTTTAITQFYITLSYSNQI